MASEIENLKTNAVNPLTLPPRALPGQKTEKTQRLFVKGVYETLTYGQSKPEPIFQQYIDSQRFTTQ